MDVIPGAGVGGGRHVKVFDGTTGAERCSRFAYEPAFRGGGSVAAIDANHDVLLDIRHRRGGPHVPVFGDEILTVLCSLFTFERSDTSGVFVGGAG